MARLPQARPFKQHQAKTLFLRVPGHVWSAVTGGRVREFRASAGNVPQLWKVPLPTVCVAYRRRRTADDYDYRLIMLECVRMEALGAITEEGLEAAGYVGDDAGALFRREWMIAEKKRFDPLRTVMVFTVRLVGPGDRELAGEALIKHLYGEYLEAEANTRTLKPRQPATRLAGAR